MPEARRTSANALVLMALGLGVIYHAGPWPWMSRALTLAGAIMPAMVLADGLRGGRFSSAAGGLVAIMCAAFVGATYHQFAASSAMDAYAAYAWVNVAVQCLLIALWGLWATESGGEAIALLGTLLALLGACMAAYAHLWQGLAMGQADPPDPWAPWRTGDYGPVDAFTRMATELIPPEAAMMAIALAVWLWVVVLPRLRRWFE